MGTSLWSDKASCLPPSHRNTLHRHCRHPAVFCDEVGRSRTLMAVRQALEALQDGHDYQGLADRLIYPPPGVS